MSTITMKFGGTSVGGVEAITNVNQIIRESWEAGHQLVVVVSAMRGVTDMLLESVAMALAGNRWGVKSLSNKMRDKHEDTINRLMKPSHERDRILSDINKLLEEHQRLCNAIETFGEITPRMMDAIVAFGERMSSRMVAAILKQEGLPTRAYEATEFLITDENYQAATPIWAETEQRIRNRLLPVLDEGLIPVITGFIGATPEGAYTTLGRGGSDYSAAIFAANVNSDEFVIWTDVDGVMTTDPRVDSRARVLPYVSYLEVGELAYYGAKVLHPKTVQPIINQQIPIRVRNTFNPEHPGTLIGAEQQPASTVIKAVTSVRNISMLTVSGKGMIGVPGIAGRTFLATANAGANILMISQSSSEQSFCFTVMDDRADGVRFAVEAELQSEMAAQNVESIDILSDVVIVTVVGSGMRGTPGVAGRVFTTLGENGVNVLSIAQGSSECSISFIVAEDDLEQAVNLLHELALEAVSV